MISTALSAIASLLLPCLASFAANTQLDAAQDPVFAQPTAAPFAAPVVRSATSAAQGSLARAPEKSNRRSLDENLKQCGFVHFTMHNITILPDGGVLVTAADLDGDGDLDVLSASWDDGGIVWYQNLDGAGNFSVRQREIDSFALDVTSVAVADLDGDADLDILVASWGGSSIAWYENLDGAGSFSPYEHDIVTWGNDLINDAYVVATADLNGDGDLEVLSASGIDDNMFKYDYDGSTLSWYENLDGAGDFSGPRRVITTEADDAWSIVAADLDGDADLDVLSSSRNDGRIAWYENLNGAGTFSVPQSVFTANADGVFAVAAADLDGDGDLDVLSTFFDGDIVWYENLDGAGVFSIPQRVFAAHADEAYSVAAVDLDGDGDLDIVSALNTSKIAWFENLDGGGNFLGPERVITTQADGVLSAAAADLDGDADLDVLLTSSSDGKIAWYENECEPKTPQPMTGQPTLEPTPEPTYWGPQVFGKQPQTVSVEHICVAWCVIFGVVSVLVSGYVVHASRHKDKNLARIILTIVLSQYDYGSDTLFIAFQNFVTPTLFVAASIIYLLPVVVFVVVYRRVIGVHIAHIYTWTKTKTVVHFDLWDDLPKALIEIGSFALFTFNFAALTFVYLMLLFVFISCKLMSVSFLAAKFFETGGFECTQEAFEVMFKRNILAELVFESSGEMIIALVDTSLRAQQDFRSNTGLSSWAVLSIVSSSLVLMVEVWPYLYHIVWMGQGLDAGIAAVSTNIKFTPNEVLGTSLIDRLGRSTGLFAQGGTAVNDKSVKENSRGNSKVHDVRTFELAEQREQ